MAQRRMFSPKITASDKFLDMPVSARELYFQLGMYADDDGFVTPKRIVRMLGASEDDLKVLIAKSFVMPFQSGVIVITAWKINNLVRKDWYQETIYKDERRLLVIDSNGEYRLVNEMLTNCQQNVDIGKVRLGKVNIDNISMSSSQESNIDVAPVFKKLERGTQEYINFCSTPIDPTNTRALDWGAKEILDFLNNNCGRHYRVNEVNLGFIKQRLKSGVSITDCRSIIEAKRKEWQSKPDMEKYLRPATLFNKTKFEQYLGELHA